MGVNGKEEKGDNEKKKDENGERQHRPSIKGHLQRNDS